MITADGWTRNAVWEHSEALRALYAARCRMEAEEMTCHAQAAELLARRVRPGETVLDAGCGAGYFWHSLRARAIPAEYRGIDASATMVAIGREELAPFGLDPERLQVMRIEDLGGEADHVVCMNVLSNLGDHLLPLERMLEVARRTIVLRESLGDGERRTWVVDEHLDDGARLKVHVNRYDIGEVTGLMREHGFTPRVVTDRRSGGAPELVIGHPHWWTFVVGER